MKHLLLLALACAGTLLFTGACRSLAATESAAQEAAVAWSIAQDPNASQADIQAALQRVADKVAEIDQARRVDQAELRAALNGAMIQGAGGGGLLGAAGAVLSWILRDRRKARGGDPMQLAGVVTPPATSGAP